jgi:hypothetical protein
VDFRPSPAILPVKVTPAAAGRFQAARFDRAATFFVQNAMPYATILPGGRGG